jgi:YVTN family beta-propeller protein
MGSLGRLTFILIGIVFIGAPAAATTVSGAADGWAGEHTRLLVLNKHDDSLMVFEIPSQRLIATIPVGDEPHEVAVTLNGSKAYVSNVGDRSITVVDLGTHTVRKTLHPERADFPHGLGITPDGRHLLVTSEGSRRFYLIGIDRDVIVRAITSSEEGMHMVAMPPRGNHAYVANRISNSLTVLNSKRLNIERHIALGSGPEGITVTPDGRLLLVALQDEGEVILLKPGGSRVLASLQAGRTPIRIAATPDSSTAIVSNRQSDDLTIIDLEERRVRTTVPVGRSPGGLAIDPEGRTAYVCNNDSNTVAVVSISELQVTGEFAVGAHPDGIAIVPAPIPEAESGSRRVRKKKNP